MKNTYRILSALSILVLSLLAVGLVAAAPIVVTPGTQASYIYFPPASAGGGGTGGDKTLAEGGDANATNCTPANIFASSVTSTVDGNVVLPATVKCIYLEIGGGKGTTGSKGFGSTSAAPGAGGFGEITKTVVFNNTGSPITLSWVIAAAFGNSGTAGSGTISGNGGAGGAGGKAPAFSGPAGVLFRGIGGGGGGGTAETPCDGGACWPITSDNATPKYNGIGGYPNGLPGGAVSTTNPINTGAAYVKYAY